VLNLETASLMKKEIPQHRHRSPGSGLKNNFIFIDKNGKLPGLSPDLHDERCKRETPTL
jgi:hypothetical protein